MTHNEKLQRKAEDDKAKEVTQYLRQMEFSHSYTFAILLSTEICECDGKEWVSLLVPTSRCPGCGAHAFRSIRNTTQFELNWFGCGQPDHTHVYFIDDDEKDEVCGARVREEWLADNYQLLILSAAKISQWMIKLAIKGYNPAKNYEHIFRLFLKRAQDALIKSDGANLRPWEVKTIKELYENTSPQQRMNLRIQMILSPFQQAVTAQPPSNNDVLWELLRWEEIQKIADLRVGNLVDWLADKWFLGVPMTESVIVNTTIRELHKATQITMHKDPFTAKKLEVMRFLKKSKFRKDIPTLDREDHSKPGTIIKAAVDSQGIFPSASEFSQAKQRFIAEEEQKREAERNAERETRRQQEIKERNNEEVRRKSQELEEEKRLREELLAQQEKKGILTPKNSEAADSKNNNPPKNKQETISKAPSQAKNSNKTDKKQSKTTNNKQPPSNDHQTYFGAFDIREKQKAQSQAVAVQTPPVSEVVLDEDQDVLNLDISDETSLGLNPDTEPLADDKQSGDELRIIRYLPNSPI